MEPKIEPLTDWLKGRKETIESLNHLANDLDQKYKTCNKAGVVGAITGVGAGGAALVSLGAAPFTGGASILAGMAMVGVFTKVGTVAADKFFSNKVIKQTQELFDKDAEGCKVIKDVMTQLCEVEIGIYIQLSRHIMETVNCDGRQMPKVDRFVRSQLNGNYGVKDLAVAAGAAELMKIPFVQQGLKAIQEQNMESIQLLKMFLEEYIGADQGPAYIMREINKIAKQFGYSGLLTTQSVMKLVGYARYFGIINAASLPFQIKILYDSVSALRDGSEHKISSTLRGKVKEMQEESEEIEAHIRGIVTDLSHLVLLINYIKKKGCDDFLDTILNMVLKEITKARYVTDILNDLHLHNNYEEIFSLEEGEIFEATTINCEGISGNPVKELMMWIWCAWRLKSGSIMFLQNTHFTYVPGFWTFFGVSINCFGSKTSCGVSILLPHDFNGAVEGWHEFKDITDPDSDWNGRCVIANIVYKHEQFTLVNIIAPADRHNTQLFIREAAKFVSKNATAPQQIVASVDFSPSIPTMTVRIPKKVSSSIEISVIKKFIPSQPVSEYLVHSIYLGREDRDTLPAQIYVDSVCDALNLNMTGGINWFHCEKPTVDHENYKDQIMAFLNLGLSDLWSSKHSGLMEFSTVREVDGCTVATVTATQTVHFSISETLLERIRFCDFDHIPRILDFTEHSPLTFAFKNKQ